MGTGIQHFLKTYLGQYRSSIEYDTGMGMGMGMGMGVR